MFVGISFVLVLVIIGAEPQAGSATSDANNRKSAATEELLKLLPNLKPFEITACSYQKTFGTKKSDVPSPADTLVQVTGWIELKREIFEELMATEQWEVLRPEQLPKELKQQIPSGELKTCKKLNLRFNSNPTIAHGILLVPSKGNERKIWLLAKDIDHPIAQASP